MSEVLLFVGGPADGHRMAVPEPVWRIPFRPLEVTQGPVDDPPETVPIRYATYRREKIAATDERGQVIAIAFMRFEELSTAAVIHLLLARYGGQR